MVSPDNFLSRMMQQQKERERINRDAGHQRVKKILDRIGFSKLSVQDKIARLHSMTPEDFYAMLSHLNGNLQNLPREKYEDRSPSDGDSVVWDQDHLSINYVVPTHRKELLAEFFARMQKEISKTNLNRYAVKLEYALVFAHPFEDGNGRTSRYARRLLAGTSPEKEDSATTLTQLHEPASAVLGKLALLELFQEELSEEDQKQEKIKLPDDVLGYVFAISRSRRNYGYAHALQGLALRKTFPDVDLYGFLSTTEYYDGLKDDSEAKSRFDANYTGLQDKLFWKAQELIDKERDVKRLGNSFRERIAKLQKDRRRESGVDF